MSLLLLIRPVFGVLTLRPGRGRRVESGRQASIMESPRLAWIMEKGKGAGGLARGREVFRSKDALKKVRGGEVTIICNP